MVLFGLGVSNAIPFGIAAYLENSFFKKLEYVLISGVGGALIVMGVILLIYSDERNRK